MPALVEPKELQTPWVAPEAEPLDEVVWDRWVAKGRAQDERDQAARIKAVKWVGIALLLGAAGLWSELSPFEMAIRLLVACCALTVMYQALRARNYAVTALFGMLAALYNPVAPVFELAGDWQRAAVAASAIPFMMSLVWPDGQKSKRESRG